MIEVSDGFYFLSAKLDAALSQRVRSGQLRAGRRLRVCLAGFQVQSCDPLELPKEAVLQLSFNACRPVALASMCRLGFQRSLFPTICLRDLTEGGGPAPRVDVVVLRVLPPAFRTWAGGQAPEERSLSQEVEKEQQEAEEAEEAFAAEMKKELEASGVDDAGLGGAGQLRARMDAMRPGAFGGRERASAQVAVLVVDAQYVARPRGEGFSSLALLHLPGFSEDDGPKVLDRLRVSCAMVGRGLGAHGRRGPLKVYHGRHSQLQLARARPSEGEARPAGAGGLPGHQRLAPVGLPPLDASCPFASLAGTLPLLQTPAAPDPPSNARGHFCDLVGALLQVGDVEAPSRAYNGRWRASCRLFVLTPSQRVCCVVVEESSVDPAKAQASLERARKGYAIVAARASPASLAAAAGAGAGAGADIGAGAAVPWHAEPPPAAALENVTFDWHERKTGILHFRTQRLHLRLSAKPSERSLRQALAWAFWSPQDVARATARMSAAGVRR